MQTSNELSAMVRDGIPKPDSTSGLVRFASRFSGTPTDANTECLKVGSYIRLEFRHHQEGGKD